MAPTSVAVPPTGSAATPSGSAAPTGTAAPSAAAPGTAATTAASGTAGRTPDPCPTQPAGTTSSAAYLHGWGAPNRADEFDGTSLDAAWDVYDGPGHNGAGRRTPDAFSLEDGILTVTGDTEGATGGMAWAPGQLYGRWEARVRAPVGDPSYNAVLLLWPDAEDWPVGGEVDFMEISDPSRQQTDFFLHFGSDNSQVQGSVTVDATQWHNWAVEWTPTHITAFLDGEQWWKTRRAEILPPGPMHLCIQLDWFPTGEPVSRTTTMQVDWVKQYPLDPMDIAELAVEDAKEIADEVLDEVIGQVLPFTRGIEGGADIPVGQVRAATRPKSG